MGDRARPALGPVVLCVVLGAELLAGAIWSSVYEGGTVYLGLETGTHAALVAAPLRWPDVDVHEYLSPGPIARALQRSGASDGRYLAWIRPDAYFNKGYLFTRKESDWPALLIGRSVLFEVPDTLWATPPSSCPATGTTYTPRTGCRSSTTRPCSRFRRSPTSGSSASGT